MESPSNQCLGISLRLNPTYIVQYGEFERRNTCRTQAQIKNQLNLLLNKSNGKVSQKADKRIRNSVNWLASSALPKRVYCKRDKKTYSFRLNFITLTLPSLDHSLTDHQFKNKLLKNWLGRMQYRHNLRNYVWKVETQANGNIHAHLTTDCFINWREIREVWNDLLIRHGLMKSFAALHGHSDPNSTDVKSVRSVKDLSAYLAKYFAKSDESRRKVNGRLWGCNYALSDKNACSIHLDPSDTFDVLTPLVTSQADHCVIESAPDSFGKKRKVATVFFMKPGIWTGMQNSLIGEHYRRRLVSIRTGVTNKNLLTSNLYNNEFIQFDNQRASIGDIRSNDRSQVPDIGTAGKAPANKKPRQAFNQLDLFQSRY